MWNFGKFGPFIDKTVDEVFVCTGLQYLNMDKAEDVANGEQGFGKYLIVVSLRGKDPDNLTLSTTGHTLLSEEYDDLELDILDTLQDSTIGFFQKNKFKSVKFRITQALDKFSHEV